MERLLTGGPLLAAFIFKIPIAIGAGKTYTMLGTDHEPGIMVLTLNDLYKQMDSSKTNLKFTVKMSYLEVSFTILLFHHPLTILKLFQSKITLVAAYLVPFHETYYIKGFGTIAKNIQKEMYVK